MAAEYLLFFQELGSHLVASVVEHSLTALARTRLTSTWALHRRDLREKVKDMPFIYRDLEGDVLNDFVDPDLRSLDIESLSPSTATVSILRERIRNRKRLLVLGEAGIGKTTFLRYEILSLLMSKGRSERYIDGERLLPFYVPLKAVDNHQPFPILRYLLANNLFLRQNGLKRITTLAEKQQLFLLLDGYDEIEMRPQDGGHEENDFIADELRYLLQSHDVRLATHLSSEHRAFYLAAQRCRFWISSRREFFVMNPIVIEEDENRGTQGSVKVAMALQLAGVGDHRHRLAETIFEKYARRSKRYRDLLSAEYFIQEIDRSRDREIVGLSYNPLFLTVMAYIYAANSIKHQSHEIVIKQTLADLIMECISLLLIDLDSEKARSLPPAHRIALLRRRNDFIEEKRAFLSHFASRLLYEGKGLFEFEDIRSRALYFFEFEYRGENSQQIFRGLKENTSAGGANIALQLIYSGIFVMVDRASDGTITYDFPHRRFREVLASQYFDNRADRMEALERCLNREDLTETLYVFFSISKSRDDLVRAITARIRGSKKPRYGRILLNCIERIQGLYDPSPLMWEFFTQAMRDDETFTLPVALLRFISSDRESLDQIAGLLDQAFERNQMGPVSLGCSLLSYFDPSALSLSLIQALAKRPTQNAILYIICGHLWNVNARYCTEQVGELIRERRIAHGFYLVVAEDSLTNPEAQAMCELIIQQLTLDRKVEFLAVLNQTNESLLTRWRDERALSPELERCLALIRTSRSIPDELYAITHDAINELPDDPSRKYFRERLGNVISYRDVEEIAQTISVPENARSKMRLSEELCDRIFRLRSLPVFDRSGIPEFFQD